jgi:thiol-disulfide isomerase/thioredoxin
MRLLVLSLLLLSASAAQGQDSPEARVEAPPIGPAQAPFAPPLRLEDYETSVQTAHAGKVLVVNFWATWCGPCMKEMPHLIAAQKRYGDEKVAVVLISADFGGDAAQPRIEKTLKKLGVPWGSFLQQAEDPEAFARAVDPSWNGSLPFTVVYDARGTKVQTLSGSQSEEAFAGAMSRALRRSKPSAP